MTEEYVHRSGTLEDKESSRQRLREFMQVFTPEGAMNAAFDRQVENKSLYKQLGFGPVSPIVEPRKPSLFASAPSAPDPEDDPNPTDIPTTVLRAEKPSDDQLPNFDVF